MTLQERRLEREAAEAADAAKLARFARRMAVVRLIIIVPLILFAAWLFWRVGWEAGYIAGLADRT